jgi:hypothetical protein
MEWCITAEEKLCLHNLTKGPEERPDILRVCPQGALCIPKFVSWIKVNLVRRLSPHLYLD